MKAFILITFLLVAVLTHNVTIHDVKKAQKENSTHVSNAHKQVHNYTFDPVQCALGVLYNWEAIENYSQGLQNHTLLIENWQSFEQAIADVAFSCSLDEKNLTWLSGSHPKLDKEHMKRSIKAHEKDINDKKTHKKGESLTTSFFTPKDALDDADNAADTADILDDIVNDGTGIPAIPTYPGENKWLAQGTDLVNCATAAAGIIAEPENPLAWVDGGLAAIHMVGDVYGDVKQYLPKPITNAVSDVGHFFGGLFNDVFGSSETSELNEALNSEEMANMQSELENSHLEASEGLESLMPENFENAVNENIPSGEETSFIQDVASADDANNYMNLFVDFLFQ